MKGKKILFISCCYLFYPVSIKKELEALGARVDLYYNEPQNIFFKLIKKISFRLGRYLNQIYHQLILKDIKTDNYDFVFFIQVNQMNHSTVKKYKIKFPESIFILYNWDSLSKNDYSSYISFFHFVYSFDSEDCENNAEIIYRPLFYENELEGLRNIFKNVSYNLSFVGTIVNLNRYFEIVSLRKWAIKNNLLFFDYCRTTPFVYVKLLTLGIIPQRLHFRSLDKEENYRIISMSDTIIDIANHKSAGYSMRSFEALGAGRKLLTFNKNIEKEDFYSPELIQTYSSILFLGNDDLEFIKNPVNFSNFKKINIYSLRNWLIDIFANR
jgi:hypothetical protein